MHDLLPRRRALRMATQYLSPGNIGPFLLCAWFAIAAVYYPWSCVTAMGEYAWLQPSFDQFRVYLWLLETPFPRNILQPDNGHHSIFPFLVIAAENRWFAANQVLQTVVSLLCAATTALVPALCAYRERDIGNVQRCGAILLSVLGVFWLANGISLLHGNEGLSVYMVSASVAIAAWCTFEAGQRASWSWIIAATLACCVATFSFGSGIASFPAVFCLGVASRLPYRLLAAPLAGLALCLALYLFILPGDDGIRGMLNLQPATSARFALQWLSAPWMTGWLGFADPPAAFTAVDRNRWFGALLADSANDFVAITHLGWRTWSILIGGAGLFGLAAFVVRRFVSGHQLRRTEAVAVGVAIFATLTGIVISIGRLDYLLANADQSYADRYLIWSSLFWASLGVLLVLNTRNIITRTVVLVFVAALPVMLYGTHVNGLGWGAAVYRSIQAMAASARTGIFDDAVFPTDSSTGRENEYRSIDALRERRLAMFAEPGFELVGQPGPAAVGINDKIVAEAHWENSFVDPRTQRVAAHFSGAFLRGMGAVSRKWQIAALDDQGNIAGLAEYSFAGHSGKWFNLGISRKRGFDGYIRDYDPRRAYTLILWNSRRQEGTRFYSLSAAAPMRGAAATP